jgi:hypothetical protein
MRRLLLLLALFALLPSAALALDPERREVVVVSGRIWDGFAYRESYLPSTAPQLALLDGKESAISFVRTQEYYWPLSRQVYVDLERQRDEIAGVLRIFKGGEVAAEIMPSSYAIIYPKGAVNGDASLVWGDDADKAYADYQAGEKDFARRFVAAQQAQADYERKLLIAAAARKRGEPAEVVARPEPVPQPSLRLVTKPTTGYRVLLPAGEYMMELEAAGVIVPGTRRKLQLVATEGSRTLVADIIPEERWTRPIASNSASARAFAKAGSTFYLTLADADRYEEATYLPIVSPQADAVEGRLMWVRRKSSEIERVSTAWNGLDGPSLSRQPFKVEQTSGTGFGYRVRHAAADETADLDAFAVVVPDDSSVTRGTLRTGPQASFSREVVVVHARNADLSLALVALPLLGWASIALVRRGLTRSGTG